METLDQIALRIANEVWYSANSDEVIEFSHRLVAELAKQRPVAWFVRRNAPGWRDNGMRLGPFWKKEEAEEWLNDQHTLHELFAAPVPEARTQVTWKSLTDEDRLRAFNSMPDMLDGFLKKWGWLHFAKAIELICKEKNTAPVPESEGSE